MCANLTLSKCHIYLLLLWEFEYNGIKFDGIACKVMAEEWKLICSSPKTGNRITKKQKKPKREGTLALTFRTSHRNAFMLSQKIDETCKRKMGAHIQNVYRAQNTAFLKFIYLAPIRKLFPICSFNIITSLSSAWSASVFAITLLDT